MVEFRILGPLEVVEDDEPLALGGPKQRALLGILILHRGELLSGERLVDELWGEHPPATAAKTLQGYISRLRKTLGAHVLHTRGRGYVLVLGSGQLDLDRFERLAREGLAALAAGDAATALHRLQEALGLWRGSPLADFTYERFAQGEIRRLEEARLAALESRIDAELALGRQDQLVAELEPLVAEHPLRERLRAQRMLALYRAGRQAEALEAYRETRRALVDQLGIEPGRELRELHQAMVEQDPRLDSPRTMQRLVPGGEARASGVFVGRERELAEIASGLDDAVGGQGRLFLLSGEPGIGKSRLAEELGREARNRGALVLVGRCWEAGGAPAFWPWVQLLRSYLRAGDHRSLVRELGSGAAEIAPIVPELSELIADLPQQTAPESEGARFRLFQATAEFLRRASEKRPLVLVLDDLHAADTPSLLLLQFIARELGSIRVLVLAIMRDVDPIPGEPLTTMLAEVAREPLTRRIELAGLSEHAVSEYIQLVASEIASAELAAALHAETEGNPLFVSETVRLLAYEGVPMQAGGGRRLAIPQTIRDVLNRRLARLSSECNHALEQASVLGPEFALDTLALVADPGEDDPLDSLDEAIVARVILEAPGAAGRLRFAHVLIRDTLYARLTTTRRVKLHRRAAAALRTRHGDGQGPHLAELAHHAVAGHDFESARIFGTRAADWAMGMLAYEEAQRLYTTALDALQLANPQDERTRCELLLSLGEAQARAGDSASAQNTFLRAAELARRLELGRELARAAAGYGGRIVWARAGNDSRLVPLLESALAALPEDELELRVQLLARLAGALRDEPSIERREAMSREAVVLARRTTDPRVLAYALDGCGSIIGGRPGTGAEQTALADELLGLAQRAGDRERVVSAHYQKFIAAIGIGDIRRAEAALTAAATVAEELRQPVQLWQVCAARAMLAIAAGRLAEADELTERARALGERAQRGIAIPTYTLQRYTRRDFEGQLADVEPAIREAAREYVSQPVYRCALIHLQARLGKAAPARRALDELARDEFAMLPLDNEWLYATSLLAEACSLLHDTTAASALYHQLSPFSEYNTVDTPDAIRGSVSRYLGILAATIDRWDASAVHFEHALVTNERWGFLPWLAHTRHDYARMLLDRNAPGDRERALELIGAALATYRTIGMQSWTATASEVERAARLAQAAGR
ncbi:MAG TPA: BTAD domain-containing putative transcriptional regulator [Solirubrobacteraceae bacterium]|nr:BTAD domain-containing putative transcriptional regulator [Solirubrobacteraceae bacterium]